MCLEKGDLKDFLTKISTNSRPVVVFGASIIGKIVIDLLDILDLQPLCFCDNDVKKQCQLFHGYEVISFVKLCADYPDAPLVIAAGRYFNDIKQQLTNAGFKEIYSDLDVISCIDFKKVPFSKVEKIVWYMAKLGKLSEIRDFPAGSLHIPRLNVVVTSCCTLNCEHCSSLMPYYETQSNFDVSMIIASLDRIFECTNLIYHVEVLGGEPFLYKDLPLIMNHLLGSGKILHIDVISNGTILPTDRVFLALKHENVSVVIDDYGRLSVKKESLVNALKRFGIDYRINKHWAWADLGGFESRKRSEEQLTELFTKCNFNSCTELLDGKLYRCPRSSHGTKIGVVPEYIVDFIDILDLTIKEDFFKEKLRSFLYDKNFIRACDHCSGNSGDSLTLNPAEQRT